LPASEIPLMRPAKIVVTFECRTDGGLRAWSDDVPGFVLSHADPAAVLRDVVPALEVILSHRFGAAVAVEELTQLAQVGFDEPTIPRSREYVSHSAAA
jgi:hypothetical protein